MFGVVKGSRAKRKGTSPLVAEFCSRHGEDNAKFLTVANLISLLYGNGLVWLGFGSVWLNDKKRIGPMAFYFVSAAVAPVCSCFFLHIGNCAWHQGQQQIKYFVSFYIQFEKIGSSRPFYYYFWLKKKEKLFSVTIFYGFNNNVNFKSGKGTRGWAEYCKLANHPIASLPGFIGPNVSSFWLL